MSANGGGDDVSGSSREDKVPACNDLMLELRKSLLLLAILAATVTYAAGLNPPGGVWLDTKDGHLTGNQMLVVTYHARYNAFSYSNATAFMASAVVILLLVFGFKDKHSHNSAYLFVVLRAVMVLDLLALLVAYAAGASRDILTTVLASVLVSPVFFYVLLHAVRMGYFLSRGLIQSQQVSTGSAAVACSSCRCRGLSDKEREDKRRRKILMLLAIFAITITYTAGLNPPGGFWPEPDTDTQGDQGHRAGDPVLLHHHRIRFAFFFVCNTISFVASLFVIMLLLTNRSIESLIGRFKAKAVPYVSMGISLLGLVGAYAAGSCRETESTAGVVVLCVVGPMLALLWFACVRQPEPGNRKEEQEVDTPHQTTSPTEKKVEDDKRGRSGLISTARSLVLLLATLAATVTYQAGLNPPGGFWPDHRDGHKGGNPILFSKHTTRYRLFFYCNSVALVASLVVIFMVLRNYLSTRGIKNNGPVPDQQKPSETPGDTRGGHDTGPDGMAEDKKSARRHMVTLEVVMILDLMGLIGAFAAGCCRDVSTSIYVVALAGGALVYVVFHIVFFTLHREDIHHDEGGDMEEKRKLLLLLAILVVTLTYQAGLTPPGGFWLEDGGGGELGHHAGDPVLLSNYPRRYTAFFYLNATGFMASVAITILLVNPNLYRAGIKCHALHVCMVAALFGLMGAYTAGSSRHVRTSIFLIALIFLVLTFVVIVLLLVFKIQPEWLQKWRSKACSCGGPKAAVGSTTANTNNKQSSDITEAGDNSTVDAGLEEALPDEGTGNTEEAGTGNNTEEAGGGIGLHTKRRYLMLLGILAASVTYQAGLAPPGGVWPDNNDGHAVGNPILRDSSHHRYHMFFYCNSASFVASVVVITLQLLANMTTEEEKREAKFLVQTAQCMMVLDLLGLLLAYAAGSTREWDTSVYIVLLLLGFCIGIRLLISYFHKLHCGGVCTKAASGPVEEPTRAGNADVV